MSLDLLYANVTDACSSAAMLLLCRSDTITESTVQQEPATVRTERKCCHEAMETLHGALEANDWNAT